MRRITVEQLMEKLVRVPEIVEASAYIGLVRSATLVHKTAQEKFGKYQPQYGPFEGWAVLATSTLQEKLKAGSASDDPLIGHTRSKRNLYPTSLRQSLTMEVSKEGLAAQVGTNNPIGKWQEYGTGHIPPRPFLRPALYQNEQQIRQEMKDAMGLALFEALK